MPQRLRDWIEERRQLAGRQPKRYTSLEQAYRRMKTANSYLTDEQARHLTHHGILQNEDGTYSWKFDNCVRVFPPVDLETGDHQAALEFDQLPYPPDLRQGQLGFQPGRGRQAGFFQ